MPNPGEEKEKNLEKSNENEVEELNENEIEGAVEEEMSKEQLEETKENIKEIESLAAEMEGVDNSQVKEKYESSSSFREQWDNVKEIVTTLGVVGSVGAGVALGSGNMQSILIATAGILTTAVVSALNAKNA